MSYSYKILNYTSVCEEVRGILGVTETEISDDELGLLPLLPAADRYTVKRCPNYASILTDPEKRYDLRLAALYVAAANVLPTLRLKLLQVETDNKTTAQRFKTALDLSAADLMAKAEDFLSQLQTGYTLDGPLITVAPATDVITGE